MICCSEIFGLEFSFYLQSLHKAVRRKRIFKSNKRTSWGIEEECSEDNLKRMASAIEVSETNALDLTWLKTKLKMHFWPSIIPRMKKEIKTFSLKTWTQWVLPWNSSGRAPVFGSLRFALSIKRLMRDPVTILSRYCLSRLLLKQTV